MSHVVILLIPLNFIIWARKLAKVPHCYNYDVMKQINNSKQMRDVWHLPAIAQWEKILRETSYAKAIVCIVAYCFGVN